MRKFFSYGPPNTKLHYYAPRKELIDQALVQMLGDNPDEGGHYITVWAPRQAGKTWVMQQILRHLRHEPQREKFDVLKINVEHLKMTQDVDRIVRLISQEIIEDWAKTGNGQ